LLFGCDGRRLSFNNASRWLWVPAFAGTTKSSDQPIAGSRKWEENVTAGP
jgi:hypothetical protein